MHSLSVAQCLQLARELESISDSARLDIELILCHILQKNRTWLFTWPEALLTPVQADRFQVFFNRRKSGEPVAHIIGQREFWSLPLAVNNSTLIPRPDTELLVETVLDLFAQDAPQQARRALDLGTGTGAIILAIASEKPHWKLLGVDFSADAVALAEYNRAALGLSHVAIAQSNWFEHVGAQLFDVIVSNPPYIDPQDPHLTQGDVRFEPLSALIADNQGLADIEHIVAQAGHYLQAQGWLLVEHGYDQAQRVRDLFTQRGFVQVETRRDLGGNERITLGRKSQE
ncbi:protein-(glutamine-N5) methyltransferase, release factor-specific [Cellvibrio mixtus]|uniref:Release factor glutamine methyltransferase n=1 Tax=Cellvibrio mixtus TaxID=39650 RepID=A0A266Q9Y5_9GAMM|nr:peptide chain release factor N(5)-glutamine methyltransferase [Cellvibrio mixtus]OZY86707.1 protein-(glutamine-N5) methyltransferase, release factor-specific [Cellvibrio mixtus]